MSENAEGGKPLEDDYERRAGDGAPEAGDDGTDASEDRESQLRQEAADNWNKYLRVAAELDNLRKRATRDVENARRFGAERLAQAILPVRDSIEAGLAVLKGAATIDVAAIAEGEQATLRLLDSALQEAGIREIDPHGEPFDPNEHEAMSMLPSTAVEPDSVLEVIQKGYALNERILRPARVIVAKEADE